MAVLSNLMGNLIRQQQSSYRKTEAKKSTLLEDPKKLDDYVGKVFQQVSPSKKTASSSKAAFLTDRVNAYIPESHPMKNFGQELKQRLSRELANPDNAGVSAKEITTGITKWMLEQPDKKGVSRLEKSYELQRLNQTSRNLLTLGLTSGEDKSLKAPLGLPGMLTYEEWRQRRFAAEKELTQKEYSLESYQRAVKEASLQGATFGAATGAVAALPTAETIAPISIPAATAAGTLAWGGYEAVAFPIKKLISETEWGSARKYSSRFRDKAAAFMATLAVEGGSIGAIESKLMKAATLETGLKTYMAATPSVKNVLAAREGEKLSKEIKKKTLKKAGKNAEQSPVLKQLSEEEEALAFARGEKTADKVASSRLSKKGKAKRTSSTELEEASKAVGQAWQQRAIPVRTGGGSEELAKVLRETERDAEIILTGEGEEISPLTRKLFPEKFGRRVSDKDVKAPDRRTAVREGEIDRRSSLSHDYVDYVGQLEQEIFGQRVTGISRDPVAREALELTGRQSQTEALANTDEPKAIDELIDYFGAGDVEAKMLDALQGKPPHEYATDITKIEVEEAYTKIGDYHDTLLKKYYPDLELDSVSAAMQKKVGRAVRDLDSKLTVEERKTLDTMIDKYESIGGTISADTEKAAEITDKVISPISSKEARKVGADIAGRETSGSISKIQAVDEFEELLTRVEASTEMESTERMDIFHAVSSILTGLKKQANIVTFLAAFGVGAEVFNLFSPEEAEAGVLSTVGKAATEIAGKKGVKETEKLLMSVLAKESHIVPSITENNVYYLAEKGFQQGLKDSAAGGPSKVLRNVSSLLKTGKYSLRRSLMSPGQQLNEILNLGEGVMNNPAVFKASYMMAENQNIKNGLKVISNILKAAEVKSAKKEVTALFEPLAPLMKDQVGFDYYTKRVGDLTQQLRKLSVRKVQDKATQESIKNTKQQLAIARNNIVKFKPGLEAYHTKWAETAEIAAKNNSSVRIFLAADDTPEFTKYPFMKNFSLSRNEQLAVGRIKRQMAEYKVRLEKEGIETKSGSYMHYTLHPKVNANMMESITGDIASAPYLKNYSRSLNSRPLMPDVFSSMSHYIPDTERRLQTQGFWNSGWKKVANKVKFIEPLRIAFEALEKGTAPIERSFGNDAARWYTNFEVYKRLFATPSAGLKHLIKLTGDMATLGVGSTLKALPSSVKGVSFRVVETTPYLKKIASKYFKDNLSEFNKLKKGLFDSVVPTMDTRWRMNQMGFGDYESYFSKLSTIADQVNHAGSVWINLAELVDRGVSVEAGLRMAAKKGLTAEQALYGIYDTVLKNNFLGREFTPRWLRNPKVKALLMFQTTPFKIMERRAVTAIRAGRAITSMGKAVKKATRTPEGRQKLVDDLRSLWKDMKTTEQELKSNLFLNSLRSEVDFYGRSAVSQFVKDILITGAGTAIGASAGVNLWHHFFHLPFLKSSAYGETYGTLSLSPGVQAVVDGWNDWKNKDYNDDEMLTTKVLQEWLGKSGPFPDIVWKLNRIDRGEIPEIYQDDKFKYLFAIPAEGSH